jgi:pyrroloquinoline-quinone synthase
MRFHESMGTPMLIDKAPDGQALWSREQFVAQLRAVGERRYHDKHSLHRRMNAGQLSPAQIRGWIANRYYYQRNIPIKDAAILSNCPIREVRRTWLHRITDHDGTTAGEGGIEAWLALGKAAGLERNKMIDERHVLPGVRFAVDAYVTLARTKSWPVAVASSLTELFAPDLMAERIIAFERYYPWVAPSGLDYFRSRVSRARTDASEGLELTLAYCDTRALQQEAVSALATKCDILWSMLDAMDLAYRDEETAT